MKIEILLTEAEISAELSEAIAARDLPEKFLYWFPLSVQAWRTLSRDPLYDPLDGAWNTLAGKAESIVKHFPSEISVVSYGAGDGARDLRFLAPLMKNGSAVRYFPVDASQSMLEIACAAAEDAGIDDVEGIKADISSPTHLVLSSDVCESPKLFLMSGCTLGAFDPLDQIKQLAHSMHEGDRLIIDGEIAAPDSLQRRDSAALRNFIFAPLASMGITGEDGNITFEERTDERHAGLHLITRRFKADRDLHATVCGKELALERGERVSLNFQYIFSPESFRWLVEKHAGLKIQDAAASADGRYIIAVCLK